MGMWDLINTTTEAVKRTVPDPAPLKNACKASYRYSSAAVGKIDNAVRINGIQTLKYYMPAEETRSQIALFASKFAHNTACHALRHGYRMIPGGKDVAEFISKTMNDVKSENNSKQDSTTKPCGKDVAAIISETMNDVKSENNKRQDMEAMKQVIGGGIGKNSTRKNLLDRVGMQSRGAEMGYEKGHLADLTANQTPEDVLRIFMMKEFIGNRLDDKILPQIKGAKTDHHGSSD